jgi:hypothetical protein
MGALTCCSLLLTWFDVPEVFEVHAEWHEDDPHGSGESFFTFMLFGDMHQIPCTGDDSGIRLLGWRYIA